MSQKFNPNNPIIKLCMQGMMLEESGQMNEALATFQKAWDESSDDYEKFISAYHLGLRQEEVTEKLKWMEKTMSFALNIDDDNVKSAYPAIYSTIAEYHEAIGHPEEAQIHEELSDYYQGSPMDIGPFYHGTKVSLTVGNFLTAGENSNYENDLKMNHIYFTANLNGASLAAMLAKGSGEERIYIVEPTGEFENDPNVTDKKFPGNLSRSYRSQEPLKIIGEATNWEKLTTSDKKEWDDKLANHTGKIIN